MNKKTLSSLIVSLMLMTACSPKVSSNSSLVESSSENSSSEVTSIVSTSSSSSKVESSTISSSTDNTPLTIAINGENMVWYDETLTLSLEYSKPSTEEVVWSSSDESIATVSNGVVTPIKAGNVVISATLASDNTISATHEITVKDVVIDTSVVASNAINGGYWDFSFLKRDNPSIISKANEGAYPYQLFAQFKNVSGQRYYAEATFNVNSSLASNTWNRIAVGSRALNQGKFRGYYASYGTGGSSIKTIVIEENTGTDIPWGELTDRTQVWNQGGRDQLNFTNIKLATLRDGNTFYYYINDQLSWVEKLNETFKDVDTVPTITISDVHASVSRMFATSDESYINSKLEDKETKRLFWGTIPGSVTVDETGDKPKITFTTDNDNAGRWPSSNIKDYAARSLGDALSIPNGKSATFEYDYKVTKYGGDTDTSFAGLSFQRYTGNVKEMRSILVGKYKAAANAWGWDGGINIGSSGFYEYENAEYGATVKENETYHVKIEVIKYDSYREYKVYINDKFTGLAWGDWDKYTDSLIVSVTALNISAEVSNFEYTIY